MSRLLGPGSAPEDLLCFASAGNIAERHWAGRFLDDGRGFHEWAPHQVDNVVTPWGSTEVSVELCWEPGASYELSVVDALTGAVVGRATTSQEGHHRSAVVRLAPESGRTYRVCVKQMGEQSGSFHLICLGGALRYATAQGSIPFPADGPEVIAVGAVDSTGQRAAYSSCGPNSRQPKPDLVAVVPFPSVWRPRPFSGTSAAAPQAAGLAALVWARHADWTAAQVREFLQSSARDLGPVGHDYETGFGMINLP
jgi:subtilisin family serine protease